MTTREIQRHLEEIYQVEVSPALISNVTDAVMEEVTAWQTRPLEALYPIVYLDALQVKIRDGAHVRNKAVYLAIGINLAGTKEVLGLWMQQTEGAKFYERAVKRKSCACLAATSPRLAASPQPRRSHSTREAISYPRRASREVRET